MTIYIAVYQDEVVGVGKTQDKTRKNASESIKQFAEADGISDILGGTGLDIDQVVADIKINKVVVSSPEGERALYNDLKDGLSVTDLVGYATDGDNDNGNENENNPKQDRQRPASESGGSAKSG